MKLLLQCVKVHIRHSLDVMLQVFIKSKKGHCSVLYIRSDTRDK